jgi:probable F420-dependent oxidoreductase
VSKLNLGPIGVSLNVSADETYLHEAVDLEGLGFSTLWLPGGQIDSLDRIAAIASATATIPVASAIISPDVYEAETVAELYADLEATSPGRFVLGLGGPQKQRSLQALNEYLDVLDGAEPWVPAQRRILAALGPRKLALARDRCGGAILLLVTPAYTAEVRRILGPDPELVVDQMVVLDTDAARARETARGPLRFLSGVGGYVANFERMGFTQTDIADLGDRLVDELVAWGDLDMVAARIGEHLAAGANQVVLTVLNQGPQPPPLEVATQLVGRLLG